MTKQNSGFVSFTVFVLGVVLASEMYVYLRVAKFEALIVASSVDSAAAGRNTSASLSQPVPARPTARHRVAATVYADRLQMRRESAAVFDSRRRPSLPGASPPENRTTF